MSVPTTQNIQLPAYLQDFAGFGDDLATNITGGLKSGGHPRIGISQSRWRLQEGAAEEVVNSLTLDVIIVHANKAVSKVFYAAAYNNKDENAKKAPDCFSDNGIGPSSKAAIPQHSNCAACPHNAWGSKISANGSKTKACSDMKKIAVVLADDPARNVYELRVPPASLQDLNKIMVRLVNNKLPIPAMVFQLSFDPNVDYPKIVFKPTKYVTEEQSQGVRGWLGSKEAIDAVGSDDVALSGVALNSVVNSRPALEAPVPMTPTATLTRQPVAAPVDDLAFLNDPAPSQAPKTEVKRRGRPAAAQASQARASAPAEEQMSLDLPGMQAAAQSTPINPQTTDEGLDALLADVLK